VNTDWRSFLTDRGAVLDQDRVAHFGRPGEERRAAVSGNVLVDLSDLALIRARGAEALSFLNTQLSNDLLKLDAERSLLAAWCNAKGRAIAVFRVFRRGDDCLLQLPAEIRDDVLERLRRFVLRAKVVLESADEELVRIGVAGPRAPSLVRAAAGFVPGVSDACLTRHEVTVLRLPGPHARFEIVAPVHAAKALWLEVARHAVPAGAETWTWFDILAGLPQVYAATREQFVPQMLNLDLIGGVSFDKGCYPGQEIVARLHHRGGLKQRLYRARVQVCAAPPPPGTPVYAADLAGQPAGAVVSAASSPQGGCDLLAVIQIQSVEHGHRLHLGPEQGADLVLELLP
jgi:folate-binding protein YgfZ